MRLDSVPRLFVLHRLRNHKITEARGWLRHPHRQGWRSNPLCFTVFVTFRLFEECRDSDFAARIKLGNCYRPQHPIHLSRGVFVPERLKPIPSHLLNLR